MKVCMVPAEPAHFSAVCEIAVKAWAPIYEVYRQKLGDELFEPLFSNWQAQKCAGIEAEWNAADAYVALLDGQVVGFIAIHLNETTKNGQIGNNAVDPAFRGRGIGPQMYEFAMGKMKEAGMAYASVFTGLDEAHAPARKAYEKAGFEKGLPSIRYYKEL